MFKIVVFIQHYNYIEFIMIFKELLFIIT